MNNRDFLLFSPKQTRASHAEFDRSLAWLVRTAAVASDADQKTSIVRLRHSTERQRRQDEKSDCERWL
jgi:hypothetical protein